MLLFFLFICSFVCYTPNKNQTNYIFIWYELSRHTTTTMTADCRRFKSLPFITRLHLRFVHNLPLSHSLDWFPYFDFVRMCIINVSAFATTNVQTLTLQSILIHFHWHTIKISNLFKLNENIVSKSQYGLLI